MLKQRVVLQCNRCKRQVSLTLTAGTIFHSTKLPLTTWFLAIYHLAQSKGGISRPGFERLLAAICEGKVGAVLAIEASRLARNDVGS